MGMGFLWGGQENVLKLNSGDNGPTLNAPKATFLG